MKHEPKQNEMNFFATRIFRSVYIFRSIAILCFSFFFTSVSLNAQDIPYDPVAVYLTWQNDPCTTMTVQWITYEDRKDDTIYFRAITDLFWHKVKGTHDSLPGVQPYLIHRVELNELQPFTDYIFRAGEEGKIYKFRTMPTEMNIPIRFVVGGDIYHDGIEYVLETNAQASKCSPMFALVGGDLAYGGDKFGVLPEGWQSWMDWILSNIDVRPEKRQRWIDWLATWKDSMITPEGRLIPMVPALGNHDVNGGFGKSAADAAFFHAFFPLPGKRGYNVLDFGNYLSIIILDTGHTNSVGGKQTRWLYETLRSRQHFQHKFALYHVPAYPSVRKLNGKTTTSIRHFWVPLFERYGITAAFEHHDHAYKRTHPLKNGKIDPSGVVFIGDGAWGVEEPRKPRSPGTSEGWYLAKSASSRHFILVSLKAQNSRVASISSLGEQLDEFPIGHPGFAPTPY